VRATLRDDGESERAGGGYVTNSNFPLEKVSRSSGGIGVFVGGWVWSGTTRMDIGGYGPCGVRNGRGYGPRISGASQRIFEEQAGADYGIWDVDAADQRGAV
jgi:hypothetical protein